MWMSLWLAAHADDVDDYDRQTRRRPPPTEIAAPAPPTSFALWELDYRRATKLATFAAIAGPVGLPVGTAGIFVFQTGLWNGQSALATEGAFFLVSGYTTLAASAPILAASSLRGASALRDGGYSVPRTAGIASWIFMGSSVGLGLSALLVPDAAAGFLVGSGTLFVGSYVAGSMQLVVNARHWQDHRAQRATGQVPLPHGMPRRVPPPSASPSANPPAPALPPPEPPPPEPPSPNDFSLFLVPLASPTVAGAAVVGTF